MTTQNVFNRLELFANKLVELRKMIKEEESKSGLSEERMEVLRTMKKLIFSMENNY